MQKPWLVKLVVIASISVGLALGCSSHSGGTGDHRPGTTQQTRSLHARQQAAGLCPGGQVPTLSASSIGLVASKTYEPQPGAKDDSSVADSRCLIDDISFVVPKTLLVTKGDAGKGRATLLFRDTANEAVVECEYRGTAKHKERSDRYDLHKCRHSALGGTQQSGDWFRLEVESAEPDAGTTEVRLELGTPNGAPIEIAPADPKLGQASLVVPPGAASPFEHFSLELLPGTAPELPLNYGVKSSIAGAYGVRVSAAERGDGASLPPSPSGAHFRLTMSYDAEALASLGAQEKDLMVLEVAEVRPWSVPEILGVRKDFTVDAANHTLTLNADRAVGYLSVVVNTRRIPYNGGPVMKGRVPVHLLYYGTVTSYQRTLLQDFVRDLAATPWMHILDSYDVSQAGRPTTDVVLGQTMTVNNPNLNPPQPTRDWVETVVQDAIDRRTLPFDGNAIYLVIAGNDVTIPALDTATSTSGSCGFHTYRLNGLFQPTTKFGLIKNSNGTAGCNSFPGLSPNRDKAIDNMVSVVAHEVVETLTNPEIDSGWVIEVGGKDVENADNCAWLFNPQYTVFTDPPGTPPPTGKAIQANMEVGIRDFLVQQNWVNIGNGYGYCALRIETDDARALAFRTSLPEPPAGHAYHPMIYGATYTADIDYQNIGDTDWRDLGAAGEQYLLGSQAPQDNDNFGVGGRVSPGSGTTVAPGAIHRFSFPFRPAAMFPGADYVFQWQMVREAVRWFGEHTVPLTVRAMFDASALEPRALPAAQSDDTFTVPVVFRNVSGAAWRPQDGYSLRVNPSSLGATSRVDLAAGESIEPGAAKTFSVALTAPHAPGSYTFRAQMQHDGVGPFGPELVATIEVHPSDRGAFESQSVPSLMAVWSTYDVRATFRNTGTATWGPGYRLVVNSGAPFHIVSATPLGVSVPPGGSHEFSATVEPDDPIHYDNLPIKFFFQLGLANPAGRTFANADALGVDVRAPIEVLATCVDPGIPSVMVAGTTYRAKTVIRNRGETTWPASFGLASTPPGDRKWGTSFVSLTQAVAPQTTFTFEYDVVAPSTAGIHLFAFMMARENSADPRYIFDPCLQDVNVVTSLSDGATYLPNEPDVTFFCNKQPMISCYRQQLLCFGHRFNVPVPITMLNSGATTWTKASGFFLSVLDASWGVTRVDLADGDAIAPGQSKTFQFDPVAPFTFGERTLQFQMSHGGTAFGDVTPGGITQLVAGCGG